MGKETWKDHKTSQTILFKEVNITSIKSSNSIKHPLIKKLQSTAYDLHWFAYYLTQKNESQQNAPLQPGFFSAEGVVQLLPRWRQLHLHQQHPTFLCGHDTEPRCFMAVGECRWMLNWYLFPTDLLLNRSFRKALVFSMVYPVPPMETCSMSITQL